MTHECKVCHRKFSTAALLHEHQIMYAHEEWRTVTEDDDRRLPDDADPITFTPDPVTFTPDPVADTTPDTSFEGAGGGADFGGGGSGVDW
jgi:hypothetical protein